MLACLVSLRLAECQFDSCEDNKRSAHIVPQTNYRRTMKTIVTHAIN